MAEFASTDCIHGWLEILHFKYDIMELHTAPKPWPNSADLKTLSESHYEAVGGAIPLCEYYSAFELYQQFAVPVDPEFNIPRGFKALDAINICVNDPKFGRKTTTLIVLPKGAHSTVNYKEGRVQFHPKYPHCLVIRKTPFKSFLRK